LNHCLRAYFWARLLDSDTRPFDDEAVFVALMLHDLGLTDRWRLQGQTHHCFTQVGAGAVEQLAQRHQWADARARVAANAITLHLNVTVGDEHGKEAQMVRAGSGGDVAGLGLAALGRDQIAEVLERYPRLNLKQAVLGPLMTEATQRPCCRTAFLCRSLGFVDLIKGNRIFSE
jgi:HD domain